MRDLAVLAALLTVATLSAVAGQPSRVQDPPPVWSLKSLSPEEIAALTQGRGLGRGRAAELNHYPGPSRVLDIADELGLERAQIRELSTIEERLHAAVAPLGAQLLEQERRLETSFAAATAEPRRIREISDAMAATEAKLRAAHLTAHLEARAVLTDDQLARYEYFQGYADAEIPAQPHS